MQGPQDFTIVRVPNDGIVDHGCVVGEARDDGSEGIRSRLSIFRCKAKAVLQKGLDAEGSSY
jgi:hypothetical protein